MRVVIIGGSDAGIAAAVRERELAADADVSVLVADRFPNYSICGLPYLLSGDVGDWRALADRSSQGLEATGMRLLLEHEAEPEVILMDEPCSALDPIATLRIEELIRELKRRYTIVIVTHNMQQAARVADTTAFMLDGELVEHARTDRIFSNPCDERTERYVTGKFG